MEQKLANVFKEYETTWKAPRAGAEQATKQTLDRLQSGEVILFEPNEAIYNIIAANDLVGQFDLGFQLNGKERGYPLLHVKKGSR